MEVNHRFSWLNYHQLGSEPVNRTMLGCLDSGKHYLVDLYYFSFLLIRTALSSWPILVFWGVLLHKGYQQLEVKEKQCYYLNTVFSTKQLYWVREGILLIIHVYVWLATLLLPHTLNLIDKSVKMGIWSESQLPLVYTECRKRQTDCKNNSFFPKALYASLCLFDIYTEVVQEPSDEVQCCWWLLAFYCSLVVSNSKTVHIN